MTHDRDFDRLAKTWLELGPNEAPDRVVAAVLQAAETTPQARRPFLRSFRRTFPMNRLSIAAVAAVLVAVVGGGMLLTRGGNQNVGGPVVTPATSSAPSPSASAAAGVPDLIQGAWMGGPRTIPAVDPGAGTVLELGPASLAISQSASAGQPGLSAQATSPSEGHRVIDGTMYYSGQLHLVTGSRDPAGCAPGAAGDYTWDLSATGRKLMVTPLSDSCATRLAAVGGEWLHVGCRDTSDNCLGDLDPGTYKTQFITPHLAHDASWVPRYGAVTYTVPDGWANAGDWPGDFNLVPSADYASYGAQGSPDGKYHEVTIWAHPAATEQTADCTGKEVTSVKQTVDGLIGWLREQQRFVVSRPTDITVGGRPGQWVDIQLAPDWAATCPDLPAGTPAGLVFARAGGPASDALGITGQERMHVVLVDIGGGDVAAIFVDSSDPARFDQLVSAGMPIIESMTFE